jgi:hypothetical protein
MLAQTKLCMRTGKRDRETPSFARGASRTDRSVWVKVPRFHRPVKWEI